MIKYRFKLASALSATVIVVALSACSPADKTDTNTTDAGTATQTASANDSGRAEDASGVAREMHNQMDEDQTMHDSMKGGAMADDQMGPGGTHGPAMKGMGSKAATDAPPKDKADPMPMTDM